MLPTEDNCLTRGVFPTAPVKPFTEYDVKLLEGKDFKTAALDGIMVVGEKIAKQIKKFPDKVFCSSLNHAKVRLRTFLRNLCTCPQLALGH